MAARVSAWSPTLPDRSPLQLARLALVDSSLWTALTLAALPLFVAHALHLPLDLRPAAIIGAAGLAIYNLDHLADALGEPGSADHWRDGIGRGPLIALVVGACLALGALLLSAPPAATAVVLLFGSVGALYGLPLLPRAGGGWWRPKDVPGAKCLLVSGAITVAAVGLPLAMGGTTPPDADVAPVALFLFAFVLGNTLMCDVGDLQADLRSGVRTLPVVLGVAGTRQVVVLMHLVLLALFLWAQASGMVAPHPELVVSSALVVLYAVLVTEQSDKGLLSLLLDGCSFVPLLAALVVHGPFA